MPINHWGDVNGRQPILFPRLSSGGKEINHVLTAQTKTEHWSLVEISARLFCFCPTALIMVNSHRRDDQIYWKVLARVLQKKSFRYLIFIGPDMLALTWNAHKISCLPDPNTNFKFSSKYLQFFLKKSYCFEEKKNRQ